jgi:hypothetical protein
MIIGWFADWGSKLHSGLAFRNRVVTSLRQDWFFAAAYGQGAKEWTAINRALASYRVALV